MNEMVFYHTFFLSSKQIKQKQKSEFPTLHTFNFIKSDKSEYQFWTTRGSNPRILAKSSKNLRILPLVPEFQNPAGLDVNPTTLWTVPEKKWGGEEGGGEINR